MNQGQDEKGVRPHPARDTNGGRVLLLGATGFTGRLIATELDRRSIPFCLAGRDPERLLAIASELTDAVVFPDPVDTQVADSVRAAVDTTDLVLTAVGPYSVFGWEVVRACAELGKGYVDVTGEQSFVRRSWDELGPVAQQTGACLVHSASFESALADALARQICARDARYAAIESFYQLATSRPSPGTRLTMKLSRTVPHFFFEDGELHEAEPMSFRREAVFAQRPEYGEGHFMPYPEVLFFSRRYDVGRTCSYLLLTPGEGTFSVASGPEKSVDFYIARHRRRPKPGPGPAERAEQLFGLGVRAISNDGERTQAFVEGCDMYQLTAVLAVEVLSAMLVEARRAGAFSPAELVPDLLDRAAEHHPLQITLDTANSASLDCDGDS